MNPDFFAKLMAALGMSPPAPTPKTGPGSILAALNMKLAPAPQPQQAAPPSLEDRMLNYDYEKDVPNTDPNRLYKFIPKEGNWHARQDSIGQARFDRLAQSPFADSLYQVLGKPGVMQYGNDKMNGLHGLTSGRAPMDTMTLYRPAMIGGFNNKLAHVTNTAEGLLTHELAHHADDVDMQKSTASGSYTPTQLHQALDAHQFSDWRNAGNEYSRTNTQEYRASVIANAIQYLRDTAALPPDARGEAQAAALRQSYEQDVPGTADVTDALIQHPIYARHPLKLARMAVRPDATAVRRP